MEKNRRLRYVLSSKHFRTSFFVLVGLWLAVFTFTAAFQIVRAQTSVRNAAQDELNNMVLTISDVFDITRTNAVSIGSLSSVQTAISLPNPGLDEYITMSEDLCSTTESYPYLSVDLFMESPRRIYVSQRGTYSYEDYFGRDIVELIREPQPHEVWMLGRDYSPPFGTSSSCITYLKRLPIYNSEPTGYLAFHIPFSYIRSIIQTATMNYPGLLAVEFSGGVLYSDLNDLVPGQAFPEQVTMAEQASSMHSSLVTSTLNSQLRCFLMLPDNYLQQEAWESILKILPPFLLVLALVVLGSFGYSFVMLRPIVRMLNQVGGPACDGDEFEQMSHTFSGLSSCIDLLTSELQRNLPFIQERCVLELALNYTEIPQIRASYEEVGLSFPYPEFAVILAGFSPEEEPMDYTAHEQRKLYVRTEAEKLFSTLGLVYAASLSDNQLLFLINSNKSDFADHISHVCQNLSELLAKNLSPAPIFSVGICAPGDMVPYHAYLQARNNLTFLPETDEGGVVLTEGTAAAIPSVDTKTTSHIVELVLDQDIEQLRHYLQQSLEKLAPSDGGFENRRRLSIIIMSSSMARMIELELDPVPERAASAIKKLSQSNCAQDCVETLIQYFSAVMNIEKKIPEDAVDHVNKAIAFIHAHYAENISIPQIAESVALNSVYLNKLFKLSTGKTISDYLNLYRIEIAKSLLRDTDLALTSISERLGYNDVRSLIRYFRKYNGISPAEFRQSK